MTLFYTLCFYEKYSSERGVAWVFSGAGLYTKSEVGTVKRFAGTAGAPARNEREARKCIYVSKVQNLRACGALRAGAPAVPANRLTVPTSDFV